MASYPWYVVFADNPDGILSMAEKQKIIFRELENIRATDEDEHVPGYEFIKLYPGRTIGRHSTNLWGKLLY